MTDTSTDPTEATYAERERLAALLADLTPAQWAAPSLCAGWRVREVVAHVTLPYRVSGPRFFADLARAGFSFNRYADRAARADTVRLSDAELLAVYGANVRHPWQPPGGGRTGALSHDLIHGLDITEPLGLPGPPPQRIAMVLRDAGTPNLRYFGVDLSRRRLVATDADLSLGDPAAVAEELTAKELLLIVTGRRH